MTPRRLLLAFCCSVLLLRLNSCSAAEHVIVEHLINRDCSTLNVSFYDVNPKCDILLQQNDTNSSTVTFDDEDVIHEEVNVSPELQSLLTSNILVPTLGEEGLCGQQTSVAFQAAKRFELWALQMFDSSARLPSGLIHGNVNQYGDFDQCLDINKKGISGKYCLAFVDVRTTDVANTGLKHALRLARSYDLIRSNFTDPGHRVPRYTSFNWAVCVPASCSHKQVEQGLRRNLAALNSIPELDIQLKVESQMCYINEENTYDFATIFVMAFFVGLLGITSIATLLDQQKLKNNTQAVESKTERALLAFSIRRSWNQLINLRAASDDISSLHGIRFLCAVGLLICHKAMALFYEPYVNRTYLVERIAKPFYVVGRTAILYTDPFILMSGLLATYSLLPELDRKKGRMDLRSKYVSRFLRITPNLFAIILFCTYVMQLMGTGPLWSIVVKHYGDLCKKNMWRNFLYVHNYFGFEDMCLTHTHQLGIDMQLFVVSPFLVYMLWRWPRAGFTALLTIAGLSTWLRYVVTKTHQLSSVVYFGVTVRRMFDTANLSYILPTHRITTYIFGILLGYYLRRYPNGLQLNTAQTAVAWTVTAVAAVIPWFGPYNSTNVDFVYDVDDASVYAAMYPIYWCTFISGLILLCHQNRGGIVGSFLRWKGFLVFTRIAYAVYLTQFPIYFFNIGTRRSTLYSTPADLLYIPEYLAVIVASVILTLLVDLPFQEVKKVLTVQGKIKSSEKEKHMKNSDEVKLAPERTKASAG